MSTISPTSSTWTSSAVRAFAWASIRWAAPGVHYWARIAERYKLDLARGQRRGRSRPFGSCRSTGMERSAWTPHRRTRCSASSALKDKYDIAFACDTDHDRHGIVTASGGLMPPNHYLSVAVDYLFRHRPQWKPGGRRRQDRREQRLDRPGAARLGRRLYEVPVGFKWFVAGLLSGDLGFGGEESAGASFLRLDGGAWSTDKDGIAPCAAGGRDHRAQRARSRRGVPHARARLGRAVRGSHRCARDPGTEEKARQARPLASPNHRARRRTHRAGADTARRATMRPSAASRSARRAAGSPRGLPAPRTSTRSTPRAFATRRICATS